MNHRQSVITFLGLLNAMPLTAKAASVMDSPTQKFAAMVATDSIPADIQEYTLTQLHIDLQTAEGRRELFLLLSAANPAPVPASSIAAAEAQEQEDDEIFTSLKQRIGVHDPLIIENLMLMIMGMG